jgi:hypothetical protein
LHLAQAKFAANAMRNRNSGTKQLILRYKNPAGRGMGGAKRARRSHFTGEYPAIGAKSAAFRWD